MNNRSWLVLLLLLPTNGTINAMQGSGPIAFPTISSWRFFMKNKPDEKGQLDELSQEEVRPIVQELLREKSIQPITQEELGLSLIHFTMRGLAAERTIGQLNFLLDTAVNQNSRLEDRRSLAVGLGGGFGLAGFVFFIALLAIGWGC